jgi:membrane protease YdiL (CAAX protease family)
MLEDLLLWLILALFLIFPFFWLRAIKEFSWEKTIKELFPKPAGWKKELLGSIQLFAALFIAFILLSSFFAFIGLDDLEKVNQSIDEQAAAGPIALISTLLVVLFIEEFFFRAFLINRTGMLPSTILFSILHIGYGSIAEIIGVFFLGLILAYWYKRNNSIIQNYLGHLFYDLVAILLYLAF